MPEVEPALYADTSPSSFCLELDGLLNVLFVLLQVFGSLPRSICLVLAWQRVNASITNALGQINCFNSDFIAPFSVND